MPEFNGAPKSDLRVLLIELGKEANSFFLTTIRESKSKEGETALWRLHADADHYWLPLDEETRKTGRLLVDKLLRYSAQLATALRNSPLAGAEDLADLREATKTARAALHLRRYRYREIEVLNDEDRVLGVRPAQQFEDEALHPTDAQVLFHERLGRIQQILKLVEASQDLQPSPLTPLGEQSASRYRPGTAFIMMWMDSTKPELVDIADAVKDVFRRFGVKAVRADDIEHEGQITQQVLNELKTAEFLFADLTGARPNVYYEVGYAHAIGRRVILYRRAGTGIHFDLAGYNSPEYTNLRDLRDKLTRRLESITNRSPTNDE